MHVLITVLKDLNVNNQALRSCLFQQVAPSMAFLFLIIYPSFKNGQLCPIMNNG
jgi:hypothetical protein